MDSSIVLESSSYKSFSPILMSSGFFEVKRADSGGYYWTLIASNGDIICHSAAYSSKQLAENAIANCRNHVAIARVIERV